MIICKNDFDICFFLSNTESVYRVKQFKSVVFLYLYKFFLCPAGLELYSAEHMYWLMSLNDTFNEVFI